MASTTSPSSASTVSSSRVAGAVALDTLFVLVFTLAGRRSHDEDGGVGAAFGTAAPFLVALAVVWLVGVLIARRRGGVGTLWKVEAGVLLALGTTLLGAFSRRFIWSDSTALVFVIVTGVFLIACFVGWRLLAAWWQRRQTTG